MYRTPDQVAQEFINEGQRRGITPRGIIICIATGLVESNLTVYANRKVPESMNLPHDAVGSDGYSVGPLQQQVIWGNGWWWGDAATCMDPTKSAGLFYDRLAKLDYNNTGRTPGSYAQQIQQSAYPDRYDERMGDAVSIYQRLSGAPAEPSAPRPDFTEINVIGERPISGQSQSRGGTDIDLLLGHTVEGDLDGEDLIAFMESKGERSYHYVIALDGSTVWDIVDTDRAAWSVLSANNRSINYVIGASYAGWTREQWIDNAREAIRVMAYLMVQDARKYDVDPRVLAPPYDSDPPGISDHHYVTVWLGDGTHTDLGAQFPWDVLESDVSYFLHGDDMPLINEASRSIYSTTTDPIGPGTEVEYQNNGMIHEQRVEDLALLGVPWELSLVHRVADGDATMPRASQPGASDRAKAILKKAPSAAKTKAKSLAAEQLENPPS